MKTQTPEHAPRRTPEHQLILILALAKISPRAACRELERLEAAARWRGGVAACAALGLP